MPSVAAKENTGKSLLWRPPIVGIVSFFLMLFAIALGHTMMILIEHELGQDNAYVLSIFLGAAAIVLLWYAIKSKNESFQTWVGFLTGLVVWMTWVEFFFHVLRPQQLGHGAAHGWPRRPVRQRHVTRIHDHGRDGRPADADAVLLYVRQRHALQHVCLVPEKTRPAGRPGPQHQESP